MSPIRVGACVGNPAPHLARNPMTSSAPTVLLANEPRAYRDVLAMAIELQRPEVAVRVGDPLLLEDEIARWRPNLVVCSETVGAARRRATSWVQLYPNGARFTVTAHGGRERVVQDFSLEDLLAMVDLALAEAKSAGPPETRSDDPDLNRMLVCH